MKNFGTSMEYVKNSEKSKTEENTEIRNFFVTNFIIRKKRQTLSLI